jgi:hypothetical protein
MLVPMTARISPSAPRSRLWPGFLSAVLILAAAQAMASAWDNPLELAKPGFHELRVLSPTVLELTLVTTKASESSPVSQWNFVSDKGAGKLPPPADFVVLAEGKPVSVSRVGFKRRVLYAPLKQRDLRIGNYLYLELVSAVPEGAVVEVKDRAGSMTLKDKEFKVKADALRLSPVVHVNQTGYLPKGAKRAFVGFYLGSLGELAVGSGAAPKFALISTGTGATNFQAALRPRADRGFNFECYKRVYEADFSEFNEPGEYRLYVPGLGTSFPFAIGENVAGWLARTYEAGLYHQRCGASNSLPFTRFTRGACHTAPADVPDASFTNAQWYIGQSSSDYTNTARHSARQLKDTDSSLYPFVRKGKVDVTGGHHDAGDYSKYTINSALLIHLLMTAVDSFTGVADLDNLGIPESGDGKSDLLQEAKWEADFLAKMQDDDGGFYFLVYPRDRRYENDVPPQEGDSQIVWPKTTSVTAAAVAALAQCGSSPVLKKQFPEASKLYLAKARKGWDFLQAALKKHGADGAYQKLTHYGHEFLHDDELAWAACELYLATGDRQFHQELTKRLNPSDPETRKWGWLGMYEGYGCAIRSYALAKKSGKTAQLDLNFLPRCEKEVIAWADELVKWSQESAYGISFPAPTKRFRTAGWYFSCDQAFELAVAAQLQFPPMNDPRPKYLDAILLNLNYEAGCNPVNVSFITGLGSKRQREIVHQWALNDHRVLPPPGIPLGSLQAGFGWLDPYKKELGALTFPADSAQDNPYPIYDRWGDSFNLSQEFVVVNQGHGVGVWAWLLAQTSLRTQPSTPVPLQIVRGAGKAHLIAAGADVKAARVLWEAAGAEPIITNELTVATQMPAWIEAEALLPDGRVAFAATNSSPPRTAQKVRR